MEAFRHSGHSAVAARFISRGISAAAFTRDLLRLSRLLWRFQHAVSSKTAHSLLSGVEVCTPRKPILGADEGQKIPP